MNRTKSTGMAAVVFLAAVLMPGGAVLAEGPVMERNISISASGQAMATPDLAYITAGLVTEDPTARGAVAANNLTMSKLITGMKTVGVAPADIQTTGFYMSPRYTQGGGERPPVMNGYSVTNQVRITVHDLKRLGEILDTAVALGANQMNGISFDVSNAENLRDAARRDAMNNAKRRAELYAAATGAQLGPVLQISEGGSGGGLIPMAPMALRVEASKSVPVESGSQMLEVSVQVTYALH
ncbi:MAG: SIMPL domain-containing protein [Proteobacteria bacterium]|nr:SIMPL domain-containing protein [Pseudomonadota bacterium]